MNARPWLLQTCSASRLENDLRTRGYRLWWHDEGVRVTAPNGWSRVIFAKTSSQALRNAYASAQEHENAQTVQHFQRRGA